MGTRSNRRISHNGTSSWETRVSFQHILRDGAGTTSSSRGQRKDRPAVRAGFQTGIFHLPRTTIFRSANLSKYLSVGYLQSDLVQQCSIFLSLAVVFPSVDECQIHYHIVSRFFFSESVAPKDILQHDAHAPRASFHHGTIHLPRWKDLQGTHIEKNMTVCFHFDVERHDL